VPKVVQTPEFVAFVEALTDRRAYSHILRTVRKMQNDLFGDFKPAGGHGVMESRIDYGPGYRLYYLRRGADVVVLLVGGDKRTQKRDIQKAQELARQWKDKPL
jgi:putative addiction module killer protein